MVFSASPLEAGDVRSSIVATVALLGACAAGAVPPPRGHLATQSDLVATMQAEPATVIAAARDVLIDWGFEISTVDRERGVATTEIVVRGTWRGVPVREYLYCGKAWRSGVEYAVSEPVRVKVNLALRPQDVGATLVRLDVSGTARPGGNDGVSGARRCRPTARMAAELLQGIADAF